MFLVTLLGFGISVFALLMIKNPVRFATNIEQFSKKSWFHLFEILSRMTIGTLLLVLANGTHAPNLYYSMGFLFCFVSIFLILIGKERHIKFAVLTSSFGKHFRLVGLLAFPLGLALIYLELTTYLTA